MQGAIICGAFVDYRHPLGWWAGLQVRWWYRPPSLLHWDISISGRWKQAIIFRAVWRQPRGGGLPPPKLLGAHPLWGEGARVMGAGGSSRQCAINLKRGLPPAPIMGGAEGGFSGGVESARHLRAKRAGVFFLAFSLSSVYCISCFYVIKHLLWWVSNFIYLSYCFTFGVSLLHIPLYWGL